MNLIMFSPQKDVQVKAALFNVLAASDIVIAVIRLFSEKTSSTYAEKMKYEFLFRNNLNLV